MSALPTASVVVCVYTEKRWFDIKAAVESVEAQSAGPDATAPVETIVVVDHNDRLLERAEMRNLMGCNMSLRAEVFKRVGGFAEDMGRIGKNPLGCEETELCIRARQAYTADGRTPRILFEPKAAVDHRVSDDRVSWRYLLRRGWAEGISKAAVSKVVGTGDSLSAESSYTMKILPKGVVREAKERNPASAAAIVACFGVTAAGYVRGRLPGATAHVRLPAAGRTDAGA